jgi:hypothetical protein
MKRRKKEGPFEILNPDTAGIDVGAESLYVAVPVDRDERNVALLLFEGWSVALSET